MSDETVPEFYDLLGLDYTATDKEIQKAFRRQAIKYHPDKNPTVEAATRFHFLTLALDTLSDPERRRKYDAAGEAKRAAEARRSKVEGERRAWIDELERSERDANQSTTARKRKQEDNETREQMLSRKGARMRLELAASMRAVKNEPKARIVPVAKPDKIVVYTAEERTIRIKCTHEVSDSELRQIFRQFGTINDLHSTTSSTKFKLSLIEYANIDSAYIAIHSPSHANIMSIDWAYSAPQYTPTLNDRGFETYVLNRIHAQSHQVPAY